MRKISLSISMAVLAMGFVACSNTTENASAENAATEVAKNEGGGMEEDARKIAELTCKIMDLMPKEFTDKTVVSKEFEEASKEGEKMKAEMQKKYTVESGDWAKFEKMAQEMAAECMKK